MKHEAEFTTKVRPWLKENVGTVAYEIKHTRGETSFRMSEMHEHQCDWLEAASSRGGCAYKIPDDGRAHKPFDLFVLKSVPSFVVIAYPEEFLVIEASKVCSYAEPSLSYEKAVEMASIRRPYKVLN